VFAKGRQTFVQTLLLGPEPKYNPGRHGEADAGELPPAGRKIKEPVRAWDELGPPSQQLGHQGSDRCHAHNR
jgi:hypothetical protein